MNRILRIKLVFVAVFAIGCVAIWGYQIAYVWPKDKCEAHGGWWDPKTRICAQPILLPKLTGRPFGAAPMITPLSSGDQESDLVAPSARAAAPSQAAPASRVAPATQSTSPAP